MCHGNGTGRKTVISAVIREKKCSTRTDRVPSLKTMMYIFNGSRCVGLYTSWSNPRKQTCVTINIVALTGRKVCHSQNSSS